MICGFKNRFFSTIIKKKKTYWSLFDGVRESESEVAQSCKTLCDPSPWGVREPTHYFEN